MIAKKGQDINEIRMISTCYGLKVISIHKLYIHILESEPLIGSTYFQTPKIFETKLRTYYHQTRRSRCFKLCMTNHQLKKRHQYDRINELLKFNVLWWLNSFSFVISWIRRLFSDSGRVARKRHGSQKQLTNDLSSTTTGCRIALAR